MDVQLLNTDPVFKGHFGVDKFTLRIQQYDGTWTDAFTREVFRCGKAVAVILFDPKRDTFVMVEQFRPAPYIQGRDAWLLEFVAGMIDDGEDAPSVAHRETQEEAGCSIGRLERICEYMISPGNSDELVTLFVGEVDSSTADGIHGLEHEHENIRVHVKPVDEVLALADAGKLLNVNTLTATLWFAPPPRRPYRALENLGAFADLLFLEQDFRFAPGDFRADRGPFEATALHAEP